MENRDQQQQGQGSAQNHPACASCKHQRRKCDETCELAPYFPASRYLEFQNAHKVFGVSNIQKIIAMVEPDQRQAAAESILMEGNARRNDPVHGCLGIIRRLKAQKDFYEKQLEIAKEHLAIYKEKEKLDGQKIQRKEEDLQHDLEPLLPHILSEVMAEMKKYEQGYINWSTLEDSDETFALSHPTQRTSI